MRGVIFFVAFITLLGASGFRFNTSILIDPLHDEFGWGTRHDRHRRRINVLLFGSSAPFAAALQNAIWVATNHNLLRY
ncbi:hypothetical protein EMGBS4_13870 [Acidimicrobiaceae bacterium]|nr:hypothetical protein EMGBS4_13870 [Acidimicrobiaceae bacterium]